MIAFLFISPYLFYTYNLTGEYLYFASSGGNLMYWSSNPNISELGQWKEGGQNILDLLNLIYEKNSIVFISSICVDMC